MRPVRRLPASLGGRRLAPAIGLTLLLLGVLPMAAPVLAASTLYVAPVTIGDGSSCASPGFNRIQDAIDAAATGDTIMVCAGTYTENVHVTASVTIQGVDRDTVIVEPATSGPVCSGGSLCNDANVFLVRADGVRITNLTVEGDNPGLTSDEGAGGKDIDARNGIITDHHIRKFDGLEVDHVTVRDIYLRGIYASSGGTFDIHDNLVTNVQADPASIAIFNWVGSGTFSRNTVSKANDAISSNHSSGVSFLDNTVTDSGSGIHTDNAGDGGGVGDVISGNHVSCDRTDSYGVWVFVQYLAADVHDNDIRDCSVGLGAFGGAFGPTVTTTFSTNTVNGGGAPGSVGAWVSTTTFGYGDTSIQADFDHNTIVHNDRGVVIENTDPATATVSVHHNVIAGNATVGLDSSATVQVDATDNWWGCSEDPTSTTACNGVTGNADANPWLVDQITLDSTLAPVNGTITGTVDLTRNSDGAAAGTVPDGTTVEFASTPAGPAGSGTTTGGLATVSISTGTAADVYAVCAHVPATYGSPEGCQNVAVYDPSAGFVTGGGWIDSPAGALASAPAAAGRADFAFQSKYQKGATVPSGHTAFVFRAGNLEFESASYQWLVIAGSKAQFRGTGTINGAGSFTFAVKAVDGGQGGADTFRIQIWDAGNGIVYDNGSDARLGGGSIIVHS